MTEPVYTVLQLMLYESPLGSVYCWSLYPGHSAGPAVLFDDDGDSVHVGAAGRLEAEAEDEIGVLTIPTEADVAVFDGPTGMTLAVLTTTTGPEEVNPDTLAGWMVVVLPVPTTP